MIGFIDLDAVAEGCTCVHHGVAPTEYCPYMQDKYIDSFNISSETGEESWLCTSGQAHNSDKGAAAMDDESLLCCCSI